MLILKLRQFERVVVFLPDGRKMFVDYKTDWNGHVQVCFDAPRDIRIIREELLGQPRAESDQRR